MKNVQKLFAITFVALLFTFSLNSCKKSDDICNLPEKADLVLGQFESVFKHEEIIEQDLCKVYDITHDILNSTVGAACTENVATARPSLYHEVIYYSTDSNFDNAIKAYELYIEFPSISADAHAYYKERLGFPEDGYYKFVLTVDVDNNVKERDENNNTSSQGLKSNGHIIYVSGTKNKASLKKGEKISITRISQSMI
jgi:hypothetical protein